MTIDKNILDDVMKNIEGTYSLSLDMIKEANVKIKDVETFDAILMHQTDFIKSILNILPLEADDCYFCILNDFDGSMNSCEKCLYCKRRGIDCPSSGSAYQMFTSAGIKLDKLLDFIGSKNAMTVNEESFSKTIDETYKNNERLIKYLEEAYLNFVKQSNECSNVDDLMDIKAHFLRLIVTSLPMFPNMCIYRMIGIMGCFDCAECQKAEDWNCGKSDRFSISYAYYLLIQHLQHLTNFYHIKGSLTDEEPSEWLKILAMEP